MSERISFAAVIIILSDSFCKLFSLLPYQDSQLNHLNFFNHVRHDFPFISAEKTRSSYFSINFFSTIVLCIQLENLRFQSLFDVTLYLYKAPLPVWSTHITDQNALTFCALLVSQLAAFFFFRIKYFLCIHKIYSSWHNHTVRPRQPDHYTNSLLKLLLSLFGHVAFNTKSTFAL